MSSALEIEKPPVWEIYLEVVISSICCIISLLLLSIHFRNVFSDLRSKNKGNDADNNKKKKANLDRPIYKWSLILSVISATAYSLTLMLEPIKYLLIHNCTLTYALLTNFWIIARGTMYDIFLIRLHTAYSNSKYKYNAKILTTISVLTIIFCVSWTVTGMLVINFEEYVLNEHILVCHPESGDLHVIIMVAFDIIMCISCCAAFGIPLKKIINFYLNSFDVEDVPDELIQKTIEIGRKAHIITGTLIGSSLIGMGTLLIVEIPIFLPIYSLVSCICVLLLTPYYDKLYDYLCCGCVRFSKYMHGRSICNCRGCMKQNVTDSSQSNMNDHQLGRTVTKTVISATVPYVTQKTKTRLDTRSSPTPNKEENTQNDTNP